MDIQDKRHAAARDAGPAFMLDPSAEKVKIRGLHGVGVFPGMLASSAALHEVEFMRLVSMHLLDCLHIHTKKRVNRIGYSIRHFNISR